MDFYFCFTGLHKLYKQFGCHCTSISHQLVKTHRKYFFVCVGEYTFVYVCIRVEPRSWHKCAFIGSLLFLNLKIIFVLLVYLFACFACVYMCLFQMCMWTLENMKSSFSVYHVVSIYLTQAIRLGYNQHYQLNHFASPTLSFGGSGFSVNWNSSAQLNGLTGKPRDPLFFFFINAFSVQGLQMHTTTPGFYMDSGDWSQVPMHEQQVLYLLSHLHISAK